ncbi:MAG: ShlB/FhaC/HecB family hemolysin secretion/activation protein [Devosia sp.]
MLERANSWGDSSRRLTAGLLLRWTWRITLCVMIAAQVVLSGGAKAQTVREIEQVIIDQSVVIRKYTPPPKRGTVRLDVIDLKAAGLPRGALKQPIALNSITVEGVTLVPQSALSSIWRDQLGTTVTVEDILEIATQVEQVYRQAGFLIIAAVPDQRFSSGNIRIIVFEDSFINTVEFRSEQPGLEQRLQPYIQRIVNMRPLRLREIERTLLLMSDLAGVFIEATLTRPTIPGEGGTLTLEVGFTRFGGAVGLDNRGSEDVGPLQLSGQVRGNDLLRLFEVNTLVGVTVPNDPQELLFGQFSQEIPIGTHGLRFGYSLGAIWSEPGGDLRRDNVQVQTYVSNVYLSYPFLRTISNSIYGRVDFRSKDNEVDVMGVEVANDRYRWLEIGGSSTHDIGFGAAQFSAAYLQGLDIFAASQRGGRLTSRNEVKPTFSAVRGSATLTANVFERVSLTGRTTAQLAFDRLPNAARFTYGGDPLGRAFDQGAISGDSGVAFSGELAVNNIIQYGFIQGAGAFVFADYGQVWNRGEFNEYDEASLASTGIGVRARLDHRIAAQVSLSVPLETLSDVADPGVRVFFSLGKAF